MQFTVTVTEWDGKELIWGDYAEYWDAVNVAREQIGVAFRAPTLADPERRENIYQIVRVYRADTHYGFGTLLDSIEWLPEFRCFTAWLPAPRHGMYHGAAS